MGRSTPTAPVARPVGDRSAAIDGVLGTYIHELFENESARRAFVENVFDASGLQQPIDAADRQNPYDRAADLVADNVRLELLVGDVVQTYVPR